MSSRARKVEVKRVRAEGAQAYRDGKSLHSNPYYGSNATQWYSGFIYAAEEAARRRNDE